MFNHLYEVIVSRAQIHPSTVVFGGQEELLWRTLTSREALARVDSLAAELAALGVREGDRVVLWAPNQWRTPIYLFALWKLGAIAVPFDREMNPEAGARIIDSIEARLIVAGFGERPAWARGREVTDWWEPGTKPPDAGPGASWIRPLEELAAVVFTSGTTGNPKGCMITHANLCSQIDALQYTIALDPSCRLASILPLSHLFELTVGMLYPLSRGAAIHYIPSRRGPDIVRVLSEQRITHLIVVPQLLTLMGQTLDEQLAARLPDPVYRALNKLAPHLPLGGRRRLFWTVHRKLGGRLRVMASGGAALPEATQRLWERLGVRIVQGYGASECSPVIACGVGDGSTPIGSVGRPIRGVEVRLGAETELLAKGPNLMRGYWQDPARTAEVIEDGWYHTGDLATIDAAGNITLSGRAKDLIVLPSGLNVWPQDVEDLLRSDPSVEDAAVIPVPGPSGGATLHAYLVPAGAGSRADDLAAIVARGNGRLAQHQRLATASWWPQPDFPRTAIGKVKRNLLPLPENVEAVQVNTVLAIDDPAAQAIASVARMGTLQEEQTLAELGIDSFGLVELALALEEKTGKSVSDGDLSTDMTVVQVRAFVGGAPAPEGGEEHAGRPEAISANQPLWPYTWGRLFRALSFPFDGLYRICVTKTVVLGGEHVQRLPRRVIFAGTHHSFPDLSLVRYGIAHTPARRLRGRLVVATSATEFAKAGAFAWYGRLGFGLYPLRQRSDRDASLRGLARLAGAGNPVLIFPQGTHTKPERERAGDPAARFRPGIGHLAAALKASVVPFGIAGTEQLIPADRDAFQGPDIGGIPLSITRGPLAIAFGAPLELEPGELPQAFTERLQQASFALTRQAEAALAGEGEPAVAPGSAGALPAPAEGSPGPPEVGAPNGGKAVKE